MGIAEDIESGTIEVTKKWAEKKRKEQLSMRIKAIAYLKTLTTEQLAPMLVYVAKDFAIETWAEEYDRNSGD